MATINVYEQYFSARGSFNGAERRGALVMLISDSEAGHIRYEASVTFFPHADEEDYAVSWDACFSRPLYDAPGRRSRKREAQRLSELRGGVDALAAEAGGEVLWDEPLRPARMG